MKKHLFSKILCLFMSAAMVFGLAACQPENTGNGDNTGNEGGDPVQYTVTFDLNGHGGTAPEAQKVDKGGHATKPATDPTDSAYDFGGWYKEAACTNEFKFAEEKIEKDTTVYAKWTAKSTGTTKYTVTFDLNGHGGTAPDAQTVDKGGHASRPATDPTDSAYDFGGWYKEAACEHEFNFATETIEDNTTVYAKWTPKQSEPPVELSPLDGDAKVYVVGDSTVSSFSDNYYLPRYGYGTQLYNYINCNPSQINNLALSGRSSLSFLTESNYNTLKSNIKEGDYLIIGFGHNDEKNDDAARFTHPTPDYQTATTSDGKPSFQYTLYENYVKLAKDKGATPILCTPIVRYSATGEYDNKSVSHVTSDGDYAAAIKKLGTDTNTAVVDLTSITKEYYKAHNNDAKYFHAFTTYSEDGSNKVPDGMDATHINMYGAKMIAYWLTTNLPTNCSLKAHIKDSISAPTYEVDFPAAIKADYIKPEYNGFNPTEYSSHKVDTIGGADWYHTAMGTLGGNNVGNYQFSKGENKYTIVADEIKMGSKFSGSNDGFGAIFTQIDITKNFEISAKVKVVKNAKNETNDQIALGIMLRDDIYIDVNETSILSNFVSASLTAGGKANMSRIDDKAKLAYGGSIAFAVDTEYEITLIRLGQVVTATIKQGSNTVTTTYTDTSFVGIDNNYFYLCLFANRGLTVEFSDVTFAITGDAQGA